MSQSILTAGLILAAFLYQGSAFDVLAAYLLGKTLAGLAVAILALRELNTCLGGGWQRASLRQLTDWREIASFAINTNLNGTVNLLVRDNAPLYLGFLRPEAVAQTEVGYFKLALSIINLVMLPIEPLIWPTYAEITRTIAQNQWQATRRLLKRVSAIAGLWTLAAGGGMALLGWWLIPLVYGAGTGPTYPAMLILLIGYGFANILNWNRPLLLALGKPSFPLYVAAAAGLVEILLTIWLVPAISSFRSASSSGVGCGKYRNLKRKIRHEDYLHLCLRSTFFKGQQHPGYESLPGAGSVGAYGRAAGSSGRKCTACRRKIITG
jgi:O-antigen/teichoic acid export membrane protein